MKVLEYKGHGVGAEIALEAAMKCVKEEDGQNVFIIVLDRKDQASIFASSMKVSQYAFCAMLAQDLAQLALRGQIVEEGPEPEGGPSA